MLNKKADRELSDKVEVVERYEKIKKEKETKAAQIVEQRLEKSQLLAKIEDIKKDIMRCNFTCNNSTVSLNRTKRQIDRERENTKKIYTRKNVIHGKISKMDEVCT